MEVKELGHLVLYVHNLDRSASFYRDVLGWRQIMGGPGDDPLPFRAAAFSAPSGRTHHELLLIEVGDASHVQRRLLAEHAIGVRDATSFGLPAHVRIAARTPAENDALAAALCAVIRRDAAPPAPSHHNTLALPRATS